MQNHLIFRLQIPADEYLRLYQGVASNVTAISDQGLKVKFPANILRPYVTHRGIYGVFAIHFDENKKFQRIDRIAD